MSAAFPSLLEAGAATLEVEHVGQNLGATLAVGDIIVAEGVPLVATGACP